MRWLFNFVAGLSMLLCVFCVVAWLASDHYAASVTSYPARMTVYRGDLVVEYAEGFVPEESFAMDYRKLGGVSDKYLLLGKAMGVQQWSVAGVDFFHLEDLTMKWNSMPNRPMVWVTVGWELHLPLWQLALLFAVMPFVWFLHWRTTSKRYRRKRGLCATCGYDLRGSESAGACPECGGSA